MLFGINMILQIKDISKVNNVTGLSNQLWSNKATANTTKKNPSTKFWSRSVVTVKSRSVKPLRLSIKLYLVDFEETR